MIRAGRPLPALAIGVGLAAASVFVSPPAEGAAVRIWVSDTAAEFSLGEARGVSVTADGALVAGRPLAKIEGVSESVLFVAAPGKKGELFVGTGDAGKVLRVSAEGAVETLATLSEQEVTAVAVGPDGAVYAGGSPGGKVYRIDKGKVTVFYDTKAQYVWSLAFSGPDLYVATGLPGEIHHVKKDGQGGPVHTTPDAHVRALFVDAQGRLWAGTSGSGLVLRIDKAGKVSTLYDSGKPEITAIAGDASGRVWVAAGSADMSSSSSEPISVPVTVSATKPGRGGSPTEEEDRSKPEVSVSVSSPRLAPAHGSARGGYSSDVLLFEEGEPPRVVWSAPEEVVFDLSRDESGAGVVAATGPRGKLYALVPDGASLLRTFDERQVTFVAGSDVGLNASTALYRRRPGGFVGEYVSPVKDTGRTSKFGAFRWEGDTPNGSRVEFSFRSGDSSTPDATWSNWSSFEANARALQIAAPDARFLQWKLRVETDGTAMPKIRRTEAAYRNRNAAPVVDTVTALDPAEILSRSTSSGSNVYESTAPDEKGIFTSLEESKSDSSSPRRLMRKGYRTIQWKASDPDSDALVFDLEFRPTSSGKWLVLRRDVRENSYSFDSTSLPDGEYVFRVTASDAEPNPGEGKTSSRESSPIRIDNTPPSIREVGHETDVLEIEAADSGSPLSEAEYSLDARKWTRVEAKDGLSDSLTESYVIRLPKGSTGSYLLVRVTDSSRNVATASFTAP